MANDIISNRRAFHNYTISERYEAGMVLKGTEVKSIREGRANIGDAFARIENNEVWLYNIDIQPYEKASHEQHSAKRVRKLLLHRHEIEKLFHASNIKGNTIVAIRMYWKEGRAKIELGVGKGKDVRDKRADIKKRTEDREASREMARFNRRKV